MGGRAATRARVPSAAKDKGGHHERVRKHRIGHLRFQACGKCSAVRGRDSRVTRVGGGIGASGSAASSGAAAGTAAAKPISREDVEAILKRLHDDQREDFDWRKSIVDLMKLLKLDSSLSARKQLAQELGYSGALDGSAEMNLWLHRQVMTKLAESGGKVPDSLKA
jgi:Domain of unknown function (DUF3597)